MRKIILLVVILSFAFMLNAQLEQRGFVRTHVGALIEDGGYSVLQNTFDWRLDYGKGDVELYVNPVFNYDGLNENLELNLRQAYFDIYFDNFDLRVGKQQIIWGKQMAFSLLTLFHRAIFPNLFCPILMKYELELMPLNWIIILEILLSKQFGFPFFNLQLFPMQIRFGFQKCLIFSLNQL